jgi:hypothetical protein
MSDDMQDQVERAEDRAEEDVEAHMQDAPRDGAPHAGATEEPPDVEGHGFSPAPVDARPID